MLYGCCTTIDNYRLLAEKGYDRIILGALDVASMDKAALEKARETIENGPVECRALNSFCTKELKLCGPGYDEDAVFSYSRALAERAAPLGIIYIGIGAPQSRNIPAGFSRDTAMRQMKKSLEAMCTTCRPFGMDVLLEAVCDAECNFITTTDEALSIVEDMALENLHIVYDTYHAFMMNEDASPLSRAMEHVKLVHVAQGIEGRRHYLRRENFDEYDVYFKELLDRGYDGEVSVEAFYDDIGEQLGETLSILKELCRDTIAG